jgi:hypothetical protein
MYVRGYLQGSENGRVATIDQSSSAENISCNVAPFFYHHSVVIQYLVSDTLYQIGDFR